MLAELTSEEYEGWYQFWRLSPWGGGREDYRAGVLAMAIQAQWSKQPMQPEEWFPNLKPEEQPALTVSAAHDAATGAAVPTKTPAQAAAELRAWVESVGGKVNAA